MLELLVNSSIAPSQRFYRDFEIPVLPTKRKRLRKSTGSISSNSGNLVPAANPALESPTVGEIEPKSSDCATFAAVGADSVPLSVVTKASTEGEETSSPIECEEVDDFVNQLSLLEAGESAIQFDPMVFYRINSETCDKVNGHMRDEAVRKLLSLHKAFFDLSAVTFCQSVFIIDQFIMRVRVKPKYMACVATAAYSLACSLHEPPQKQPSLEELVNLTRCGGTEDDLARMAAIIRSKLPRIDGTTTMDYLRLFEKALCSNEVVGCATASRSSHLERCSSAAALSSMAALTEQEEQENCQSITALLEEAKFRVLNRILYALTCFSVRRFSPACLALSTLCLEQTVVSQPQLHAMLGRLSKLCNISNEEVFQCASVIEAIMKISYKPGFPVCCDELFWCLSRRTRNHIISLKGIRLRPLVFDAIPEQQQQQGFMLGT